MKAIKIRKAITRTALVLLIGGMFAQSAEAQRRSRGGDQVKELDRRLELSDEQKTQIQKIMDDAKESAKDSRENVQAQIDAVLNDDQKAKRSELQESRKNRSENFRARGKRGGRSHKGVRGKRSRGSNRGNNRGVNMRRELRGLDLSDEQKESLRSLRAEQREILKTAREEAASDAKNRRAALKEQAEQYKAKVEALLTDEQKTKMKENQEERSNRVNRRGRRGR